MSRESFRSKIFQNSKDHFHEPEKLYQNLYESTGDDEKLCIQTAIESKNTWDGIHANKKLQKIIILRTIVLSISSILQILFSIFEEEMKNRYTCYKLSIVGIILIITISIIYSYRESEKNK